MQSLLNVRRHQASLNLLLSVPDYGLFSWFHGLASQERLSLVAGSPSVDEQSLWHRTTLTEGNVEHYQVGKFRWLLRKNKRRRSVVNQ